MKPLKIFAEGIFDSDSESVQKRLDVALGMLYKPDDLRDNLRWVKADSPVILKSIDFAGPVVLANNDKYHEFYYEPDSRYTSAPLTFFLNKPKVNVHCNSNVINCTIASDDLFAFGVYYKYHNYKYKTTQVENLDVSVSEEINLMGINGFKNCTIHKWGSQELHIRCTDISSWSDFDGLKVKCQSPKDRIAFTFWVTCGIQESLLKNIESLRNFRNTYGKDSKEYIQALDAFLEPILSRFPNTTRIILEDKNSNIKKKINITKTKSGEYTVR